MRVYYTILVLILAVIHKNIHLAIEGVSDNSCDIARKLALLQWNPSVDIMWTSLIHSCIEKGFNLGIITYRTSSDLSFVDTLH